MAESVSQLLVLRNDIVLFYEAFFTFTEKRFPLTWMNIDAMISLFTNSVYDALTLNIKRNNWLYKTIF